MNIDTHANELYLILTEERHRLPDFLMRQNKSDVLEELLQHIHDAYRTELENACITKELFLGRHGLERNKQLAFCEMPTYELLTTIAAFCIMLNITQIEEIMAGTGLMSCMLQKYWHTYVTMNTISITATDGYNWCETSGKPTYIHIKKKYFIEYLMAPTFADNKLYIFSHPAKTFLNELSDFVLTNKPACMMFLMQEDCYPNFEKYIGESYNVIRLYPKQICFRDVFSSSNIIKIYHSSLICVIRKNTHINITAHDIIDFTKNMFPNMSDDSYHEAYHVSDISCLHRYYTCA